MSSYLHHLVVQHRAAEATVAGERDRRSQRPASRPTSAVRSYPIVRADPEPTAHPSPEAWPSGPRARAVGRPSFTSS
ncbi:MAG TPA: hypothetical protein VHW04_09060 [Solirubrobacteraceae bacterium]|nr:hypothetical protein [Solirubrobacteraceae bacterium]